MIPDAGIPLVKMPTFAKRNNKSIHPYIITKYFALNT